MKKLLPSIITIPLILLLTVIGLKGQVGFSSNIGTSTSGGGSGNGTAGTCPAGSFVTSVNIGTAPTCSFTAAFGTQTTSQPFSFIQTRNNGATTFQNVVVQSIVTAQAANSTTFEVNAGASGTTKMFCVGEGCASTVSAFADASGLTAQELNVKSTITQIAARFFCTVGAGGCFRFKSVGNFSLDANGAAPSTEFNVNGVTLTSGWGTGATVSGNSTVGRITIGTSPGASGVLTFATAYETNAPHCDATDETTGALIPVTTVTTAAVTFTGTFTAVDSVSYHCIGWHVQ